ncbi:hypothetical protein ACQEVM_15675 [Streptomyces sp. CA-243310]|uniref:hypothetical protein n=1 Tax=Streptomyces sp. CA-243310 TaxID=3240056 RepID=UPI003D93A3A1
MTTNPSCRRRATDLDFSVHVVHVDHLPVSAVHGVSEVARVGMTEDDCREAATEAMLRAMQLPSSADRACDPGP